MTNFTPRPLEERAEEAAIKSIRELLPGVAPYSDETVKAMQHVLLAAFIRMYLTAFHAALGEVEAGIEQLKAMGAEWQEERNHEKADQCFFAAGYLGLIKQCMEAK